MTGLLDENGYPTDEALAALRTFNGTPHEMWDDLLVPLLGPGGGHTKGQQVEPWGRRVYALTFATGGWSGVEKVVAVLTETMFWFAFWQTSTRGGAYRFNVPVDQWDTPLPAIDLTDDRAPEGDLERTKRALAVYEGEDGLPVHMPIPVDASGAGGVDETEAHHWVCWCRTADCAWNQALAVGSQ